MRTDYRSLAAFRAWSIHFQSLILLHYFCVIHETIQLSDVSGIRVADPWWHGNDVMMW